MSLSTLKICGLNKLLEEGITLAEFYKKNGAPDEFVKLVAQSNKRYGTNIEKLAASLLNCIKKGSKKNETGWDLEYKCGNKTIFIEIKGSRYWQGIKDFKWQHILADHEWSHIILAALDFQELKLYMLTKDSFMELMEKGIVTQQGGAGGQGCWFERNKAIEYLHPIDGNTIEEYRKNLNILMEKYPCSRTPKTKEQIDKALQKGKLAIEVKKDAKKAAAKKVKADKLLAKKAEQIRKKKAKEAEKLRKKEEIEKYAVSKEIMYGIKIPKSKRKTKAAIDKYTQSKK